MSTIFFSQLPIGARFEFRGRRYEKLATSFAGDEDRCGNVFQGGTEVVCLGTPTAPEATPGRPALQTARRFKAPPATQVRAAATQVAGAL